MRVEAGEWRHGGAVRQLFFEYPPERYCFWRFWAHKRDGGDSFLGFDLSLCSRQPFGKVLPRFFKSARGFGARSPVYAVSFC